MRHRESLLLLFAVQALFFAPVVFRGEVIFPHDNSVEVGAPPVSDSKRLSNRRFSDQSSVYVPEIHHQLQGNRSGWISTWNPHVEMGRPTMHISSFSKAFVLTHILSWFTGDAFWLYTWLAVSSVVLTGLFGYLLLQSLGMHPAACLSGALGLSLGVFPAYWLTFVMFIWGICWTLALLWLVTRFLERATLVRGLGVAFSVHALLLTAYPQQIVWHAYICLAYALLRLVRQQGARKGKVVIALQLLCAVLAGLVSVLPVYLDLALNASRSARLAVDPSFFLSRLPSITGWGDLSLFLAQLFDAFWFGNPMHPEYISPRFMGLCWTPVLAVLMVLSLADRQPLRLWPAQLFVGLCLLMTLWPEAYAFGIRHLGLSLSRWVPLAAAFIPAMVLAAYGADHILRAGLSRRRLAVALASLPAIGTLVAAIQPEHSVDGGRVAIGMALFLGTVVFAWIRRASLLVGLAVGTVLLYSTEVVLTRPRGDIRQSSAAVDWLRNRTADGSRFAWVGGGRGGLLQANQEALLGLRSLHTYNSLSSRSYQQWLLRISRHGPAVYGRRFANITGLGRARDEELDLWGVGVLLSRRALPPSIGSVVATFEDGLKAYEPRAVPRLEAQIGSYVREERQRVSLRGRLHEAGLSRVERSLNLDDRLQFRVTPAREESLLFVSGQYHPQWKAFADRSPLETVVVNDFYQGVILPPGTSEVELRFLPFVRFSWIPQLLFAVAATFLLLRSAVQGRRVWGPPRLGGSGNA